MSEKGLQLCQTCKAVWVSGRYQFGARLANATCQKCGYDERLHQQEIFTLDEDGGIDD